MRTLVSFSLRKRRRRRKKNGNNTFSFELALAVCHKTGNEGISFSLFPTVKFEFFSSSFYFPIVNIFGFCFVFILTFIGLLKKSLHLFVKRLSVFV